MSLAPRAVVRRPGPSTVTTFGVVTQKTPTPSRSRRATTLRLARGAGESSQRASHRMGVYFNEPKRGPPSTSIVVIEDERAQLALLVTVEPNQARETERVEIFCKLARRDRLFLGRRGVVGVSDCVATWLLGHADVVDIGSLTVNCRARRRRRILAFLVGIHC